ncbi:MAG: hypothetical protein QOG28_4615 [Trebonia sp.]|nr:hypothetical protein [Trebonia sp.]
MRAGQVQSLGAELADRVEHAERGLGRLAAFRQARVRRAVPGEHVLVDQADERWQDLIPGELAVCADRFRRRDVEAAGEDRQPRPQQLLGRRAQRVAPLDRGPQRLVARRPRAPAAGEQPQPVVDELGHLAQRQRAQPDGGELDGQGNAVEPPADRDDVREVLLRHAETRHRRRGPLREQLNGVRLARRVLARVRHRQRAQLQEGLARRVKRLPARRQDGDAWRLAEDGARKRRARVDEVLAGIEDEQQLAVADEAEQRVELGSLVSLGVGELGERKPGRDRVREQPGIAHPRQLDQVHAVAETVGRLARHPHREPGLADPASPGDGDEPRLP